MWVRNVSSDSKQLLLAVVLLLAAVVGQASTVDARMLRVGTECNYPPFNYRDDAGVLQGYDVDVARALGERTERQIEFVCQEWEDMIPALVEQKFDVIAASMAITEKRQEAISFSVAYRAALGVFVGSRDTEFALFGDDGTLVANAFSGLRVGVLSYSVYDNWMQTRLPQVEFVRHDRTADLYQALQTGSVDLVLTDPVAVYPQFLSLDGQAGFGFVGDPFDDAEHFGTGFGLGIRRARDSLRDEIDEALSGMIADGTLTALSGRHFPFDIAPAD